MKIKVVWFENFEDEENNYWIDSNDDEAVAIMRRALCDPENDTTTYYTEDGNQIFHWPIDEQPDEEEDYYYSRVGIDFSPSSPWNAPGMSIADFIC